VRCGDSVAEEPVLYFLRVVFTSVEEFIALIPTFNQFGVLLLLAIHLNPFPNLIFLIIDPFAISLV